MQLLTVGGKVVILRRWNPERMLALLGQEHISMFFAVPTQFQDLSQSKNFATTDFSRLRSSQPLPRGERGRAAI